MSALITIELVRAWPDRHESMQLQLADGSTVRDAFNAAGGSWLAHISGPDSSAAGESLVGIWGKRVELEVTLSDGDRVELYRPLLADPKLTRQRRANEQGYRWEGRTRRAVRGAKAPQDSTAQLPSAETPEAE